MRTIILILHGLCLVAAAEAGPLRRWGWLKLRQDDSNDDLGGSNTGIGTTIVTYIPTRRKHSLTILSGAVGSSSTLGELTVVVQSTSSVIIIQTSSIGLTALSSTISSSIQTTEPMSIS